MVLIGGAGVSQALLAEVSRALHDHELIKVRLPALERAGRDTMAAELCSALGAEDVQGIGRIRVLYRARVEDPAQSRAPASRTRAPTRGARSQR